MAHLKGFGLENFRVFKEHTWFDFAPITLLIGPNSSGKSSLNKALYFFKNIVTKQDLDLTTDEDWLQLGDFERLINDKSENNEIISFSYPYILNHFPTIGVTKKCKLYLDFQKKDGEIRLKRCYIFIDEKILLEDSEKGVRFNLKLFNDSIYLNEDSIKILSAFEDFITGKNPKSISLSDVLKYSKENEIIETPLLKVENLVLKEDENYIKEVFNIPLLSVKDLYHKKKYDNNDFWSLKYDEYREALNGYKLYNWEDEFTLRYPLKSLLMQNGLSNAHATFLNDKILNYPSTQNFTCFEDLKKKLITIHPKKVT